MGEKNELLHQAEAKIKELSASVTRLGGAAIHYRFRSLIMCVRAREGGGGTRKSCAGWAAPSQENKEEGRPGDLSHEATLLFRHLKTPSISNPLFEQRST